MREAGTDELVELAQRGDQRAYEALFARVAERILLYVRIRLGARLRESVEPLDVLQETYLEAHRSFATFQPREPGAFSRWLFGVADNRLRDLADHFGAEKRQALQAAVRGSEVLERLRAEEAGPSTDCARREEQEQLARAMTQLDPREREALLLRYFHGQTLEAIAAELQTSEPTVRRLLARAQIKLGGSLRKLTG